VVTALLALPLSSLGQASSPPLDVAFAGNALVISGLRPSGTVAVFGVVREAKPYHVAVRRVDHVLADTDGDGRVSFAVTTTLSDRSVWIAVDTSTGAFGVASPDIQPLVRIGRNELSFPGRGLGELLHLDINRAIVDVLVVRGGRGAWKGRLVDGGASDADRKVNNFARLQFDTLARLSGQDQSIPHALPGDTIVLVDPTSLHLLAGRIGVEVQP
jgi:hypothetical protein